MQFVCIIRCKLRDSPKAQNTKKLHTMRNELPATLDGSELKFIRLGEMEDIDMTVDLKTRTMTFECVFYDEETEDWDGREVYASEIENQMEEYAFCAIQSNPLSFRELKAIFSHKMFAQV